MKTRLLSLALALSMVLALVPALLLSATATEAAAESTTYTTSWQGSYPVIVDREETTNSGTIPYSFRYQNGWSVGNKSTADASSYNKFTYISSQGYHIISSSEGSQWDQGGMYLDASAGGKAGGALIAPTGYHTAVQYVAAYTGKISLSVTRLYFARANHCFGIFLNGEMVWPTEETLGDDNHEHYTDLTKWFTAAAAEVDYGINGTQTTGFKNAIELNVKAGDVIEFVDSNGTASSGENGRGFYNPDFEITYTQRTATLVSSSLQSDFNFTRYDTDGVKGYIKSPLAPQNWNTETMGALNKLSLNAYYQNYAKLAFSNYGNGTWAVGAFDAAKGTFAPTTRIDLFADRKVNWTYDHDNDPETDPIVAMVHSNTAVTDWVHAWAITEAGFQTVLTNYINGTGSTSPWTEGYGVFNPVGGKNAAQPQGIFAYNYTATVSGWATFRFDQVQASDKVQLAIYVNGDMVWPSNGTWYTSFTENAENDLFALNTALNGVKAYVEAGDDVRFCLKETAYLDPVAKFSPAVTISAAENDTTAIVRYHDVKGNLISSIVCELGDDMPQPPVNANILGYDYTGDGRIDNLPATVTSTVMDLYAVFETGAISRFDKNFPTIKDNKAVFTGGWKTVKGTWNVDYATDTETDLRWTYALDMGTYSAPALVGTDKSMWDGAGGGCYVYGNEARKFAVRSTASKVGVGAMYTAPYAGTVNISYTKLQSKREVNAADLAGKVSTYFAILLNGEVIWPSNGRPWHYESTDVIAAKVNDTDDVLSAAQNHEAFPTNIQVNAGDEITFVGNMGNPTTWMAWMDGAVTYTQAYAMPITAGTTLGSAFGVDYYLTPASNATACGIEYNEEQMAAGEGNCVSLSGIAAKALGDDITVRPYQVIDGKTYYDAELTITVAKLLEAYTKAETASTVNLAVAMLNYGAAAQTYFGYKTDKLVNACLDDTQKVVTPADEGYAQATATALEGATAKLTGISLLLNDMIDMKVIVEKTGDGFGETAKLQIASDANFATNVKTVDLVLRDDGETYKAIIESIPAGKWNDLIYIRVMEGDTAISRTIAYAVTSYCGNMQTNTAVKPVADAILAIYDAAAAL